MTEEKALGTAECSRVLDMFLTDMRELDEKRSEAEAPKEQPPWHLASRNAPLVKRERDGAMHVEAERASQTPRKNHKKKSSQTWFKRKQELQALRQEAQEMETLVDSLMIQRVRKCKRFSHGLKVDHNLAATREKMRTKTAQDENAALKRRVRGYALCLSRLQAAMPSVNDLNKQLTDAMASTSVFASQIIPAKRLPTERRCSFTALEARVDLRFQEFPSILEELQKTSTIMDQENVQIRCRDTGAAVMEYKLTRVLPFDGGKTYERVWSLVEAGGYRSKQASKVSRWSDNAHGVESRSMLPLAGSNDIAAVDACTVVKRFVVPEHFVFLAESSAEYRGVSSSWSFSTQESIWFAIRRVPLGVMPGCESLQAFGCQLNAAVRSESVRQDLPQGITPELVMNSVRDHIDLERQYLENTLWDSARTPQHQ
ncbi:hypothetical protein ON010_g8266 [Phytophthora cinnamomi]|nr:hypothetical protein ON010_g8266 [Phytophthora cinnamomi]